WGEGVSYFDIMRMNEGLDRRGAGFEPSLVFNIAPGDPVLLYHIPQSESNANTLLGYTDSATPSPQPVADY
ncbi:MAG: RagB/SusD family nutrient uptake outer membrane protein, partial [Muribaculum sp.]|nr:RagB/SusD family nutrient uptake outer membrane protein [Muribaculum sp.]